MSVATLVAMASRPGNDDPNKNASLNTNLGIIAAYIPSEVLGVYTAVLGVTATLPNSSFTRWAIYVGTLLLLVVFMGLQYAIERKERPANNAADPKPSATPKIAAAALAVFAFTLYVMALPLSPFGDGVINVIGGILAIVFALLLPLIGRLVGVSPKP